MKDKKKVVNKIMIIMAVYIVVGIVLPFIFKFLIFESTAFSNLSNNEWAGFLGSYVGGILGGLGTLISVYITVKDSRDMQAENKRDTDQKLLEDKEEREKERKEDKRLEGQKERRQFAADISVYIGTYITHISKYYYASRISEKLHEDCKIAKDKLKEIEKKICVLDKEIDKYVSENDFSTDGFVKLDLQRQHLSEKKCIAEREYNEALRKKENNSKEANRLKANECYFVLNTKLYNIAEANALLDQLKVFHNDIFQHLHDMSHDWLEERTHSLIEEYNKFKIKYEMEGTN